jgi:phosphate-selective porin OprO/OprP
MRKFFLPFILVVAFIFSVTQVPVAAAEDLTLAEKLLEIMRANHQISEAQYKELKKEAEKEKAALGAQAAQAAAARAEATQAAQAAQAAQAQAAKAPVAPSQGLFPPINATWKNYGLYFESADQNFTMHFGGRLQLDVGGDEVNHRFSQAFGDRGYGVEPRRARLEVDGTLYNYFDYMLEYDFAASKVTDAWITYKGIPCLGNLRVGHQKEPFSLEELTSDNWFDFTERSTSNGFVTAGNNDDYNTGAMLFNQEFGKRMTYAVGGFIQQSNPSGTSFQKFNNFNLTARVTGLPWYENEGCQLVHVGFGYRHLFRTNGESDYAAEENNSGAEELLFKNKPSWHLPGTNTVNTGFLAAEGVDEINPELAFVYGPFSMQGEYFHAWVNDATNTGTYQETLVPATIPVGSSIGNAEFSGYYAFASYFLTGEHRNYNTNSGIFERIIPNNNFNMHSLCGGAWEIAARYSNIDLNDNLVTGGEESDWTGSLIWWLNPNMRIMFDYVHAHVYNEFYLNSAGATKFLNNGDANIVDTRFQVVW